MGTGIALVMFGAMIAAFVFAGMFLFTRQVKYGRYMVYSAALAIICIASIVWIF